MYKTYEKIKTNTYKVRGYIYKYIPIKDGLVSNGYIPEHRLVMEEYLGRSLNSKEEVHHLNKNRRDNRIENLILCKDRREHFEKYHPELYFKYFYMNRHKEDLSFDDFLNAYKKIIQGLCEYYCYKDKTNKVEYDDLYQEACLKLFEVYKDIDSYNTNFIKAIIKNHIINYIQKWTKGNVINVGLIQEDFNPMKEQGDW